MELNENGVKQFTRRGMTVADSRSILNTAFGNSKRSFVKGRAVLSSVLNFGIRNEWCDTNPVSRIEIPRVQKKRFPRLPRKNASSPATGTAANEFWQQSV